MTTDTSTAPERIYGFRKAGQRRPEAGGGRSSMNKLVVPAEFKGRKASGYPKDQIIKRDRWFKEMREAGFSARDISQAAGISATRVSIGSHRAGYKTKSQSPVARYNKKKLGINFGKIGPLLVELSEDEQWQLAELSFERNTTVAAALIEFYLESRSKK